LEDVGRASYDYERRAFVNTAVNFRADEKEFVTQFLSVPLYDFEDEFLLGLIHRVGEIL
jgi:hypothetical protein